MDIGPVTLILVLANVAFSIWGFQDMSVMERFKFKVGPILGGEYHRMITSGFLHVNGMHLFFNMLTLYFFGRALEPLLGPVGYLGLYFGALIGGDLLALFVHRKHPTYSAVGASGAISGVLFAFVMYAPMQMLYIFFFLPIPAFLFAILYVGYSLYGVRTRAGNIGHEAHLGGAIIGILFGTASIPFLFPPQILSIYDRLWLTGVLLVPIIAVFYLYEKRPDLLRLNNPFSGGGSKGKFRVVRGEGSKTNPRDRYYNPRKEKQKELDGLLDKVSRKGINSLSKEEHARLDELSAYFADDAGGTAPSSDSGPSGT